jgi:hypothetical protein
VFARSRGKDGLVPTPSRGRRATTVSRPRIGNNRTAAKVLFERARQQLFDHGIVEVSDFDALRRAYDIQRRLQL